MTLPIWVWETLGLEPTQDRAEIRRAYAHRLRENPPETDAASFQKLRAAYEMALRAADGGSARARSAATVAPRSPTEPPLPPSPVMTSPPSTARPARPEPSTPVPDAQAHRERGAARDALAALDARLSGRIPSSAAELHAALDLAINSGTALLLADWPAFETMLARLLAQHFPHSDPLLPEAQRRLGWGRDHLREMRGGAIAAVLARCAALETAASLRQQGGSIGRALELLGAPVPSEGSLARFRYGFENASLIRHFFRVTLVEHPDLRALLEQGTFQWWHAYLAVPRLSERLAIVGMGVSCCTLAVVGATTRLAVGSPVRLLPFAAAALSGPALALGWLALVRWPRYRLQQDPSVLRRLGWVPAALALLFVSAWLPGGPVATIGVALAGIACCIWASLHVTLPVGPGRLLRFWWNLLLAQPFIMLWAITISVSAAGPVGSAGLTVCGAAAIGSAPMTEQYGHLGRNLQFAYLVGLVALCIATAAMLWVSLAQVVPFHPLALLVTSTALLSRPVRAQLLGRAGETSRLGYYVLFFGAQGLVRLGQLLVGSGDGHMFDDGFARAIAAVLVAATLIGVVMNRPDRQA